MAQNKIASLTDQKPIRSNKNGLLSILEKINPLNIKREKSNSSAFVPKIDVDQEEPESLKRTFD